MIIDKLERMEGFTSQEKEVAKYILENISLTKELSTEELAKATFTSPATVVRLCKKLETKGYNDFKLNLFTEYLEAARVREFLKDEPITKESKYEDIIDIIPKMYDSAITNTKLMLNSNVINRVTNRLKEARKIDLYGYGISYSVAREAAFKFLSIGIDSMAHDGLNEHYIALNRDHSHMVAILISFTEKNSSIIKIAKYLKSHGIYVVGISGYRKTEMVENCNEVIQIDTKKLILSIKITSHYTSSIFGLLFYSCS